MVKQAPAPTTDLVLSCSAIPNWGCCLLYSWQKWGKRQRAQPRSVNISDTLLSQGSCCPPTHTPATPSSCPTWVHFLSIWLFQSWRERCQHPGSISFKSYSWTFYSSSCRWAISDEHLAGDANKLLTSVVVETSIPTTQITTSQMLSNRTTMEVTRWHVGSHIFFFSKMTEKKNWEW